ncbi:hypothetical protein DPMN_144819 [Dreissena polymorpha]|uniref:Uncharacterized protein n=1 Tax=Dreissena polymorpha TaxID=45954 RepID=A0A9D4F768_DREPO|nr:hypothetical protein DPMN_144819 [Dreissena polymorpha]
MLLRRQRVPTIELDVGHALLYRAVLIPGIEIVVTDHLHVHEDATLGNIIPIAADLVPGIAGIKVLDRLNVGIVVPTILIVHITILFRILMSPYLMYQFLFPV